MRQVQLTLFCIALSAGPAFAEEPSRPLTRIDADVLRLLDNVDEMKRDTRELKHKMLDYEKFTVGLGVVATVFGTGLVYIGTLLTRARVSAKELRKQLDTLKSAAEAENATLTAARDEAIERIKSAAVTETESLHRTRDEVAKLAASAQDAVKEIKVGVKSLQEAAKCGFKAVQECKKLAVSNLQDKYSEHANDIEECKLEAVAAIKDQYSKLGEGVNKAWDKLLTGVSEQGDKLKQTITDAGQLQVMQFKEEIKQQANQLVSVAQSQKLRIMTLCESHKRGLDEKAEEWLRRFDKRQAHIRCKSLSVAPDGPDGPVRLYLGAKGNSDAAFETRNSTGKTVAQVETNKDGDGCFTLWNKFGQKCVMATSTNGSGAGYLILYNTSGQPIVEANGDDVGDGSVRISSRGGENYIVGFFTTNKAYPILRLKREGSDSKDWEYFPW